MQDMAGQDHPQTNMPMTDTTRTESDQHRIPRVMADIPKMLLQDKIEVIQIREALGQILNRHEDLTLGMILSLIFFVLLFYMTTYWSF